MFPMSTIEAAIAIAVVVMLIVARFLFYSPEEYGKLKTMYKEQIALDDIVIEKLEHSSPITRFLFRWTTRNVESYFK